MTDYSEYTIVNGWVCREANQCTCGAGRGSYGNAHEPGCGLENLFAVEQAEKALNEVATGAHRGEQRPKANEFDPSWTLSPSVTLSDIVIERGWDVRHIAENTDVDPIDVASYLSGHQPYPASWAVAFAKMLDVSPQFIWNLQNNHLLDLALGKTDVTKDHH